MMQQTLFIKYQELFSQDSRRILGEDYASIEVLGWQENCNSWSHWSTGFHPSVAVQARSLWLRQKLNIHSCYSTMPRVNIWQGFDKLLAYSSKQLPRIVPTHHYVCMNLTVRPHRAYCIRRLAAEEVFHLGRISWGEREPPMETAIKQRLERQFKRVLQCERPWIENQADEKWQLPNVDDMPSPPMSVWADTAFNLVTETHHNKEGSIVTEKIWQPMWHARPVLCNGPVGVHQHLLDNGYQLMVGIDYAFDSIASETKRVEELVKQVARLCKQYTPKQIVQMNRSVALHNQRRIYEQVLEEGMPWAVTAPGICTDGAKNMREHLVGIWHAICNDSR